ncbi:MAG: TfoX/Sxy family protein [Candidatus Omnitrophica bacterium]|nr:TfoX/Sxy family protein [Candidatus Omnitrophota bacterium]
MNGFVEYVLRDALGQVRGVTARAMFGGHGLYRDGVIFGLIADDELYFKVDAKNLPEYRKRGSRPFTYGGRNGKRITMSSYWEVPAEILEDRRALEKWVEASVRATKR